ncbi:MAG: serine hydrolase [Candidatus Levybacteria bacterium]|nr:serine hydrolase [Candidatus Levybacteria bacterium]
MIILYSQYKTIQKHRGNVRSLTTENQKLSNMLKSLREKSRQISVSSNDAQSKNVKIGEIINTYAKTINGDISIYYKNLTTSESVVVDGERDYYMASLYKVIVTLYVLDMEKGGKLSLDEKVGEPPITIGEALEKIIEESNNEYAQALAEKYGWKTIATHIKNSYAINFSFSEKLEANVVNIGKLFVTIAQSERITERNADNYLLHLLGKQQLTAKLPKYLPKSIYSHNKTGEFENYSHDAGIFFTPKANYVLAFMSKTEVPWENNEQMALMSKDIYETLNN